MFITFLFWFLVFMVFYTYFGYGLLVKAFLLIRGKTAQYVVEEEALPTMALIIAAYNEEEEIKSKLENTLALDYPEEKLLIIVVTDGSSDKTAEIVSGYSRVLHLHMPERKGKVAAINRAVRYAGKAEILVFSDANTILNREALRRLVVYYSSPIVGGVSGEKKVEQMTNSKVKGENLYWRYESALKKLDADFYTVIGAAGELFSIRSNLYPEVPENIILDDFYISLKVCEQNYLVKYEPEAYATEKPSFSMKDEKKRKIRISAGAFQSMADFKELMNPIKYGKLSFQFLSRRVFRWVICPVALPLIFIINIILTVVKENPLVLYQLIMGLQVVFYSLAIAGWILEEKKIGKNKLFYVPYYFFFMNLSVWSGFFRYINGRQSAIWEKATRAS